MVPKHFCSFNSNPALPVITLGHRFGWTTEYFQNFMENVLVFKGDIQFFPGFYIYYYIYLHVFQRAPFEFLPDCYISFALGIFSHKTCSWLCQLSCSCFTYTQLPALRSNQQSRSHKPILASSPQQKRKVQKQSEGSAPSSSLGFRRKGSQSGHSE